MKTIAFILSFAALSAFADYKILRLEQTEQNVLVEFITEESFDSICPLSIESVSVTTARSAQRAGLVSRHIGVIEVKADVRRESRCLRASGGHSAVFEIQKGSRPPKAQKGAAYLLRINGVDVSDIHIE